MDSFDSDKEMTTLERAPFDSDLFNNTYEDTDQSQKDDYINRTDDANAQQVAEKPQDEEQVVDDQNQHDSPKQATEQVENPPTINDTEETTISKSYQTVHKQDVVGKAQDLEDNQQKATDQNVAAVAADTSSNITTPVCEPDISPSETDAVMKLADSITKVPDEQPVSSQQQCMLSQSSVDDQMEKVIDNIVDLQDHNQISQNEQHSEVMSKEQLVENIQKNIIGEDEPKKVEDESNLDAIQKELSSKSESEVEHEAPAADANAEDHEQIVTPENDDDDKSVSNANMEVDADIREEVSKLEQGICMGSPEDDASSKSGDENVEDTENDVEKQMDECKDIKKADADKIDQLEPETNGDEQEKQANDEPAQRRERPVRASKRKRSPSPPPQPAKSQRRADTQATKRNASSRVTIATSVVEQPQPEPPSPPTKIKITGLTQRPMIQKHSVERRKTTLDELDDKKYRCFECGYATDRLNNIVHHKKTTCSSFQRQFAVRVEEYKKSYMSPTSSKKKYAR